MADNKQSNALLDNAYKLESPDDNIDYYDAFAETYEKDFADALGYYYPQKIAEIYHKNCTHKDIPLVDIGCGTGLLAEALEISSNQIDGVDISAKMLTIAKHKKRYRNLYKVDLTQSLDSIKNNYGAVLSVGTFTSGHLGPEPLVSLLDIARKDALFVMSIRDTFYKKAGFEPVISDLIKQGLIKHQQLIEVPIYEKENHEHSHDKGYALVFRKV